MSFHLQKEINLCRQKESLLGNSTNINTALSRSQTQYDPDLSYFR